MNNFRHERDVHDGEAERLNPREAFLVSKRRDLGCKQSLGLVNECVFTTSRYHFSTTTLAVSNE